MPSPRAPDRSDAELLAANRKFYDALWTDARLVGPERFNTWPLVSALVAQSHRRLEIAAGLRPRLAGADQGFERALKMLDIRGLALVEDDEIDVELLHPPIFMGLQKFPRRVEILGVGDAQKNNRQIAGNSLRP